MEQRKQITIRKRARPFGLLELALAIAIAGTARAGVLREHLARAAATAKAGETIHLPAGVFRGGVTLPPGVSLQGAGFDKTFVEASEADGGLTIEGGSGASVSDLAIRNARRVDLAVRGAHKLTISRVVATGSINGISLDDLQSSRVENSISADNRYGIIVSGGRDNVVVNCTLSHNDGLGLSFPRGENAVAFNNCITDGGIGVYLGDPKQVRLDHNLYFTSLTGGMSGQIARAALTDWQYLSKQDAHSVRMQVEYHDAKSGDYRAVNSLPWALDRAVVSGWGVADLAGVPAPRQDIAGTARPPRPGVGAFEISLQAQRPAAGQFMIQSDEGIKSAGVFNAEGREVTYLFHELPLPKGTYSFWLPPRDYVGRPILAGKYDVRVAGSNLEWQYLGWFGDNGEASPWSHTASAGPGWITFDHNGHLLMGQGWSEDHTQLRAYDVKTGKVAWSSSGEEFTARVAVGDDGSVYLLRAQDHQARLSHLKDDSGDVIPYPEPNGKVAYYLLPAHAGDPSGFAQLDGRLYISDEQANCIRSDTTYPTDFSRAIPVPAPASLAADSKNHLLWVISAAKTVIALKPDGTKVAEASPAPEPAALAVRDGVLAVVSRATGKIHLFDCSNPQTLKPLRTIGSGDGPFGPFATDRFVFQFGGASGGRHVEIALGPDGQLGVVDANRLLLFDQQGKCLWYTFGVFGNGTSPCVSDRRQVFDPASGWSMLLDEEHGTWRPEAFWQFPFPQSFPTLFQYQGRLFSVTMHPTPDVAMSMCRFDNYRSIPVLEVVSDKGHFFWRRDTNGDGKLDASDHLEPMQTNDGKPLEGDARIGIPSASGALGDWGLAGLDARGVPQYKLPDLLAPAFKPGDVISPYSQKSERAETAGIAVMPDRTRVANVAMRSSPLGMGLANGAGSDVAGFDPLGNNRWFHPYNVFAIYNMNVVGPVGMVGVAHTDNILAFNQDGLGLGGCSQPSEAHYMGFWLDHAPAIQAYTGHDGQTYVITADNSNGRHHWYRMRGADKIETSRFPIDLPSDAAKILAALPDPPKLGVVRPPAPIVRIPHLAEAMKIDGSLEKWRKANITPRILATPDTATGEIDGPKDASAVIRLAWRDTDLYVQVLRFCKVINMTQPIPRHYQQDCVEMNLNGFADGFKFDFTKTLDHGNLLIRQRFFFQNLEKIIPDDVAPLSITTLDNAKDVPERKLIESVYGVDMSDCKVIVSELKLPIDSRTYEGDPKALFPMQPGQTFRLGFMIDSNDHPGADGQNFIVWPATYGTFNPKEVMATAVLE